MEPIVSETYTIGRLELAYATAGLYVRLLWWALAGMPLGGLAILATMDVPIMRYLGTVMVLWPITIPGRALIITSDQRKLYMRPTVVTCDAEALFVRPENGVPIRIPLCWIQRARRVGPMYVLTGPRGRVVFLKADAFAERDRPEVDRILRIPATRATAAV